MKEEDSFEMILIICYPTVSILLPYIIICIHMCTTVTTVGLVMLNCRCNYKFNFNLIIAYAFLAGKVTQVYGYQFEFADM